MNINTDDRRMEDHDYGEYDDGEMRPSYLFGCIILVGSGIVIWTVVLSILRFLFLD